MQKMWYEIVYDVQHSISTRLQREAKAMVEIWGHQGILVPEVGCSLLSVQRRCGQWWRCPVVSLVDEGLKMCLTKSVLWHIKDSQRRQKLAPSRISLVKISAGLHLPLMCVTVRVTSLTHLQNEFFWFLMWWFPSVIILWHHWTQVSLLLNKGMGVVASEIGYPGEERWNFILQTLTVSLGPMLDAWISASQELRAVCSCRSVFQVMGPLERNRIALLILQNLNKSSWIPAQIVFTIWDPQ